MKIYLAASYGRKEELRGYARLLQDAGHEVTSSWLWNEVATERFGWRDSGDPIWGDAASRNLWDVAESDALILFSEPPLTPSSGGCHVEFGYALALGKRCIVIGPVGNIFHRYPTVELNPRWLRHWLGLDPVEVKDVVRD